MKKILCLLLVLVFVCVFSSKPALAIGRDYGGRTIFTFPCACSVNTGMWMNPLLPFSPLLGGIISYPPIDYVKRYLNFAPEVPGSMQLGQYIPLVQSCWEWTGAACIPVPSVGVIWQVGSGSPI